MVEMRRARGLAEPAGGVALRVAVDQQDALLESCEPGGEVDRGGGLADPTLLVGDSENLGHSVPGKPIGKQYSRRYR